MRIGPREIVFLIVLLAVPVVSYFYVFKPRNQEIRVAQKEVEDKQAKLAKLQKISTRIEDINRALEEGSKAIAVIERKLPSDNEVDVVLDDVTKLAEKARLTVKSFKADKDVPAATYMERPLNIVIAGDFEGFYTFMREVESLPRITRIHKLKLARAQGEKSEAQMVATFTLSIYFRPASSGRVAGITP